MSSHSRGFAEARKGKRGRPTAPIPSSTRNFLLKLHPNSPKFAKRQPSQREPTQPPSKLRRKVTYTSKVKPRESKTLPVALQGSVRLGGPSKILIHIYPRIHIYTYPKIHTYIHLTYMYMYTSKYICTKRGRAREDAGMSWTTGVPRVPSDIQEYLAHKKLRPPFDRHRALGMVLLYGLKGGGGS